MCAAPCACARLNWSRSTFRQESVTWDKYCKTFTLYRHEWWQSPYGFCLLFFKWAIPGIFFFVFAFSIELTVFNIIFANDWIWPADLWNWKQPLYQLSHNHYHCLLFFGWQNLKDVTYFTILGVVVIAFHCPYSTFCLSFQYQQDFDALFEAVSNEASLVFIIFTNH